MYVEWKTLEQITDYGFQLCLRMASVESILQDTKQMTEVAKVLLSELISNLEQIRTTGGLITRWLCKSHM